MTYINVYQTSETNMKLEWRDVVGLEGRYQVSNFGQIKAVERTAEVIFRGKPYLKTLREKVFHPSLHGFGYPQVNLVRPCGSRYSVSLHTLIARAFLGEKPEGMYVCHNDGDPGNCRADNLRYDTQKGNMDDRAKHGTCLVGEGVGTAKLSNDEVREMKEHLASKMYSTRQLAEKYGVEVSTVRNIRRGTSWKTIHPVP